MSELKILITGVAGLIGSRFARWMCERNYNTRIYGVDNLSNGFKGNVPLDCLDKFYKCDVESDEFCRIFDKIKPHFVFHFAAYAAECLSPFIRKYNYVNNLVATANVINCCIKHDVKRLVFTSSMAVYGRGFAPFDECDECNPIDPYGIAKLACEKDIQVAVEQHGLEYCILRPHNVFGEGQNIWDRYRNVIGIWMRQSMDKKPMLIYGDGNQKRAFSYIDNCLSPMWCAAIKGEARNQIINLGGIEPHTINEICKIVSQITGNKNIEYKQKRHEVHKAYSTYSKSQILTGYSEDVSLFQGIENMWLWANRQKPHKVKSMRYEIDKNIYSYWGTK